MREMRDEEQRVREEKKEKEEKSNQNTGSLLNGFFFVEFVESAQGTHAIFIHSHADNSKRIT